MPAPCDGIMEKRQTTDRRVSKPLMEKRRRARINHCLSQLKSLVVDREKADSPRPTKLEKADILELTVRHLSDIKQRHRTTTLVNDPNLRRKFQVGFEECAREVDSFLSSVEEGMVSEVKRPLKLHLLRRLRDLNDSDSNTDWVEEDSSLNSTFETDHLGNQTEERRDLSSPPCTLQDTATAEQRKASPGELSLIPRRLPNGDVALVLPPQVLYGGSISCPLSAFRIVCSNNATDSDMVSPCSPASRTNDTAGHRIEWPPSPPLSSIVADLSGDDEFQHADDQQNEALNKNFVWRPW